MAVFVLDKHKQPLMPCSEKRARLLLDRGRARVHKLYPFTIRLVDRTVEESELQPIELKLDPGSKATGIAVVRKGDDEKPTAVLFLAELAHRGKQISEALTARVAHRRHRRSNLRYRPARFDNRTKPKGWLAPSLRHRVETTMTWVDRLCAIAPITHLVSELVRFDMQLMENPEISGVEYQQGTLAGYETRECLLEKWNRTCAYCGATDVPLQIEHVVPKSRGGTDRISNLTLACEPCNQAKGSMPADEFLKSKPSILARIKAQMKRPLKDAAAVNSTRLALVRCLEATGLPVETGSGGLTKWNRTRMGIPKTHALDAACVGAVDSIVGWQVPALSIKATGRGRYRRTLSDKYGFPRAYLMKLKMAFGFKTGDMVRAVVPRGKNAGVHVGRVAVRSSGRFNIRTSHGLIQSVSWRNCTLISRGDGYYCGNPSEPIEETGAFKDGLSLVTQKRSP